jgi:predicted  nucleic acid-binding Zn-ribbon protein
VADRYQLDGGEAELKRSKDMVLDLDKQMDGLQEKRDAISQKILQIREHLASQQVCSPHYGFI